MKYSIHLARKCSKTSNWPRTQIKERLFVRHAEWANNHRVLRAVQACRIKEQRMITKTLANTKALPRNTKQDTLKKLLVSRKHGITRASPRKNQIPNRSPNQQEMRALDKDSRTRGSYRSDAVLDGAEAVGLPGESLALRSAHRHLELVGAAHLQHRPEPRRRRGRRKRLRRRTRGQRMGDSWALGEPERLGGGAGGGGGALEPLEGGEAAGLDAAALLLREPHGLRRDLHEPRPTSTRGCGGVGVL